MGEPYNSLNHFKSAITYRLLVAPADENYFLARWCRINRVHAEFFWQAQQSIEKYLKASLVVNDVSVKDLRHDLSAAFEKHKTQFGDLVPQKFKKPRALNKELWRPKTPELFLKRIETKGHPDGRYRLISWYNEPSDLFMLDQLVFSLRRLTFGTYWTIGTDWKVPATHRRYVGASFGDILRTRPKFVPRSKPKIPTGAADIAGDRLEDTFFAWNFSYRRSQEDLTKNAPSSVASIIGAASNSETYLMYDRLATASRTTTPILLDGVRWFVDHFHIDPKTKAAFEQRLAQAVRRN